MEHEKINELIVENMKNIFGFSLSRLQNREAADELASDIIYEILKSAPKLSDESRFYAFMWRIAENKYADHLRKKYKQKHTELDETMADDKNVETDVILKEDLTLLRRELSLLSEQYRRATVMYYIEGLSCSQISEKMSISTEMVKYYLFRARKIIREGMNMERIYGEKSYNPKHFEIDFWGTKGGADAEYKDFQTRKIKGNILLAAYYAPVSLQEISMELGVAVPYLEDEVALLLKKEYIIEKNGKYIANIPIFTKECNEEIEKRLSVIIEKAAEEFTSLVYDDFKKEFGDKFESEIAMRWQMATLCANEAFVSGLDDNSLPADGPYRLVNGGGGRGFIWGRSEEQKTQIHGIYSGYCGKEKNDYTVVFNFQQTLGVQNFSGNHTAAVCAVARGNTEALSEKDKNIIAAEKYVKDGKANFPVYTKAEFKRAKEILAPMAEIFRNVAIETTKTAAFVTAEHSPTHIKKTAEMVGAFAYGFDTAGKFIDRLYEKGWLAAPDAAQKCAMCLVKMK